MLKYKYPILWEKAKEICKNKNEGMTFENAKQLRKFVKDNESLTK